MTQYSSNRERLLSVSAVRLEDDWGLEVRLRFDNDDTATVQVSDAQARSPKLFEKAVLRQTGRPFSAAAAIGRRSSGHDGYLPGYWRKEVSRHWGRPLWPRRCKRWRR